MILTLLQMPGGPRLLVISVIGLVLLAITLGLTYWVYSDATERGNDGATLWAVATFLGLFILGPLGLVVPLAYVLVGRE